MAELTSQEKLNKVRKLAHLDSDADLVIFEEVEVVGEKVDNVSKKVDELAEGLKKKAEEDSEYEEINPDDFRGEPGKNLTWDDLTDAQKASLKGEKGDDGKSLKWSDLTDDQKESLRLMWEDLTPEQKEELRGEKGDDGSPDTGDEIIHKINESAGKIKADRIEFPEEETGEKVEGVKGTGQGTFTGSGSRPIRVLQDGEYVSKNVLEINFVGATIDLDGKTGRRANVTLPSGGGFNVEMPVGDVDGSNATFTVENEPQAIVVDGIMKFPVEGTDNPSLKTYTLTGGVGAWTITIDGGGQPVYQIRSLY